MFSNKYVLKNVYKQKSVDFDKNRVPICDHRDNHTFWGPSGLQFTTNKSPVCSLSLPFGFEHFCDIQ